MHETSHLLDPKILGFWAKCVRTASEMSQEALAEASSLNIRTIQRIESGEPVNSTTRRLLAKGLGYDDDKIFDSPKFASSVMEILGTFQKHQQDEYRKKHPDHMSVQAKMVESGNDLIALVQGTSAFVFHVDESISPDAHKIAACIFDYLQDLDGIVDEMPYSQQQNYANDLRELLIELKNCGVNLYLATRRTKVVGENWADKTPMSWTIRYLTALPADKKIEELMVPRRIS